MNDFGKKTIGCKKFDSNGDFIMQWGTVGRDDGQFMNPTDIY